MARVGATWEKCWQPVGATWYGPQGGTWEIGTFQYNEEENWAYEGWVCTKSGVSPRFHRRRAVALMDKAMQCMRTAKRVKSKARKTMLRARAMRLMCNAKKHLHTLEQFYSGK